MTQGDVRVATQIEVTADYLPSPEKFRQDFQRSDTIGTVRAGVMKFFGVADRNDGRRVYTYYLSFEGRRLDNMSETLEALVGNERHAAHFQLVEQIQEG